MSTPQDLLDLIEQVRSISGKPVGIKAVIGDHRWLEEFSLQFSVEVRKVHRTSFLLMVLKVVRVPRGQFDRLHGFAAAREFALGGGLIE